MEDYQTLIEDYRKILASTNHHGNIIVFSDEEFGRYQPTIQYMICNNYLKDAEIDNCNAFHKTESFPYFEQHMINQLGHTKMMSPQNVTNIHVQGKLSGLNIANGNHIQQSTPATSDNKSWSEKYLIPVLVAVIGVVGTIIAALIQ